MSDVLHGSYFSSANLAFDSKPTFPSKTYLFDRSSSVPAQPQRRQSLCRSNSSSLWLWWLHYLSPTYFITDKTFAHLGICVFEHYSCVNRSDEQLHRSRWLDLLFIYEYVHMIVEWVEGHFIYSIVSFMEILSQRKDFEEYNEACAVKIRLKWIALCRCLRNAQRLYG